METILAHLTFFGGYIVGAILLIIATVSSRRLGLILISLIFIVPQHGCIGLLALPAGGSVLDFSSWRPLFYIATLILIPWYIALFTSLGGNNKKRELANTVTLPVINCSRCEKLYNVVDNWDNNQNICPDCLSEETKKPSNQSIEAIATTPVN